MVMIKKHLASSQRLWSTTVLGTFIGVEEIFVPNTKLKSVYCLRGMFSLHGSLRIASQY